MCLKKDLSFANLNSNVQEEYAKSILRFVSDVWFDTSLHEAACWNDVDQAKALLASGCDVKVVGREGWSALAVAVFMGRLEVARLLIDSGRG